MKQYEVEFHPITAIVEAENKNEAEEEAITNLLQGELQYEVKEVREIKETK